MYLLQQPQEANRISNLYKVVIISDEKTKVQRRSNLSQVAELKMVDWDSNPGYVTPRPGIFKISQLKNQKN